MGKKERTQRTRGRKGRQRALQMDEAKSTRVGFAEQKVTTVTV